MSIEPHVIEKIRQLGANPQLSTAAIAYICEVAWETANRHRAKPIDPDIHVYAGHRTPYSYARELADTRRRVAADSLGMCLEKLGRIERNEQDPSATDLREMVRYYREIVPGITGDDLLGLSDMRRLRPVTSLPNVF